jgi:hypothetical protein
MQFLQDKDFGDLSLKWLKSLHCRRFKQFIPSGGTGAELLGSASYPLNLELLAYTKSTKRCYR